jgi:hypothetical protein
MQLNLQIPPQEEPLTYDEVTTYLKLPENRDRQAIHLLISSARDYVEQLTGRVLIKQKWQLQLKPLFPPTSPLIQCGWHRLEIRLPRPPLIEVESVKWKGKEIPFLVERDKVCLPPLYWDQDISITFWAGYGEKPESLPPSLKMGVLMATQLFYDHQDIDLSILNPFKVHRLI